MSTSARQLGHRTSDIGQGANDRSSEVRSPLSEVLTNITLPLFLFSVSLSVLLVFSWIFLLPRFTRFSFGDQDLSASALVTYRAELQKKVREAERKRDALLLPHHNAAYTQLTAARKGDSFHTLQRNLLMIAAQSTGSAEDVVFTSVTMDGRTRTVHLAGRVENVGPRSMTVLAQFVEALKAAPFVESLTPPAFSRTEKPAGTFFSPFSFHFTLHAAP